MNRWVEFLHNNKERFLVLDLNGFVAERHASAVIDIRYEDKVICKITPDFIQHTLEVLPPTNGTECDLLTELFGMLGMPQLRARWYNNCGYIQRIYKCSVVSEYALREPYLLKVTI